MVQQKVARENGNFPKTSLNILFNGSFSVNNLSYCFLNILRRNELTNFRKKNLYLAVGVFVS